MTTTAPRATLTSSAPSGIAARNAASTSPRVSSVIGTVRTTTSARGSSVRQRARSARHARRGPVRATRSTLHSKPASRRSTAAPTDAVADDEHGAVGQRRPACSVPTRRAPARGRSRGARAARRARGRPRARPSTRRARRARCTASRRRARSGRTSSTPAVRVWTTRSDGMPAISLRRRRGRPCTAARRARPRRCSAGGSPTPSYTSTSTPSGTPSMRSADVGVRQPAPSSASLLERAAAAQVVGRSPSRRGSRRLPGGRPASSCSCCSSVMPKSTGETPDASTKMLRAWTHGSSMCWASQASSIVSTRDRASETVPLTSVGLHPAVRGASTAGRRTSATAAAARRCGRTSRPGSSTARCRRPASTRPAARLVASTAASPARRRTGSTPRRARRRRRTARRGRGRTAG